MSGGSSNAGPAHNNVVPFDYGDNKKSNFGKIPKFKGDREEFSWWKTNSTPMSWV
jgi:hypothetical protein